MPLGHSAAEPSRKSPRSASPPVLRRPLLGKKDISYLIEVCVEYAAAKGLCNKADANIVRNRLMYVCKVEECFNGKIESIPDNICDILSLMCDYAAENNMLELNTPTYRELFDNRITGAMLMSPSQIEQGFFQLFNNSSSKAASDWFYKLCTMV